MALTEKEIKEIQQKTTFEITTKESEQEVLNRTMWKPYSYRARYSKKAINIQTNLFLALAWLKCKPDEFWDKFEQLKKVSESTARVNHWNKEFRAGKMDFVEYDRRFQAHRRMLQGMPSEAKNYGSLYDLISVNLHTKLLLTYLKINNG